MPVFVAADILLRAGREVNVVVAEAEGAKDMEIEAENILDLIFELVGPAEDMGVVLGETAHAEEAVQGAGTFVAVDRAQLAPADRQLTVAALLAVENPDMEGAVHRLELVLDLVDVHRRVHVLAVEIEMAGGLPQVLAGDMRGVEQLIVVAIVLVLPEILDQAAQLRPLGLPENEPGADFVADGEQLEFLAEAAMIALLGLFEVVEVFLEVLLVEEGGAIDALQHIAFFVTAPVGAGDTKQLEGLDERGVGQMRAAAEVGELAHLIEGDDFGGQVFDEFDLEFLFLAGEFLDGGGAAQLRALKRQGGAHQFLHLRLDGGEVLRREGLVVEEVVVEAVFDGRADGDLDIFAIDSAYCQGHDVRGAVAQHLEGLVAADLHRAENGVLFEGGGKIDQGVTNAGGNGLLALFVGKKAGQGLFHGRAGGDDHRRSLGNGDGDFTHELSEDKNKG